VNLPRVPAAAVARSDCRLAVVARHGVGYDSVDIPAMTRAGVIVTHTPSSMPRPVATIALSFVLALAGRLFLKDRLARTGRWHERMDNMGMGPHRPNSLASSAPVASARSSCGWRACST
jgi:D-3-phosphoglycerate dehydrogenase